MYLAVHDDVSMWHKRNNPECSRESPRRKVQLSDIVLNLAVQVEGEQPYALGKERDDSGQVGSRRPSNMHVRWTDIGGQVAARRSSNNSNVSRF